MARGRRRGRRLNEEVGMVDTEDQGRHRGAEARARPKVQDSGQEVGLLMSGGG